MRSTRRRVLVGGVVWLLSTMRMPGLSWAQVRAESQGQAVHVFDLVVKQGRRVSGPAVLKVTEGDEVTLHVTCDTDEEFHLHGYNLLVNLVPNNTATIHLVAKLTGRFTYELHKSGLELGALEVYPR